MNTLFRTLTAAGALAVLPALAGAQQTNPITIPMAGASDADAVNYSTMCTGEDWVVFNAVSQQSGKIVSVCVSEGDDSTPSHLTYRYGVPDKPEMVFPAAAAGSADKFTSRRYTRPQVTYLKFEFSNGGFNYEILDGGDAEETHTELRVVRESDGKVVAEHTLTPQTNALSLMQLEGMTRTAPFDE